MIAEEAQKAATAAAKKKTKAATEAKAAEAKRIKAVKAERAEKAEYMSKRRTLCEKINVVELTRETEDFVKLDEAGQAEVIEALEELYAERRVMDTRIATF